MIVCRYRHTELLLISFSPLTSALISTQWCYNKWQTDSNNTDAGVFWQKLGYLGYYVFFLFLYDVAVEQFSDQFSLRQEKQVKASFKIKHINNPKLSVLAMQVLKTTNLESDIVSCYCMSREEVFVYVQPAFNRLSSPLHWFLISTQHERTHHHDPLRFYADVIQIHV